MMRLWFGVDGFVCVCAFWFELLCLLLWLDVT